MNVPIYRAKKIDSDEYIQGYLLSKNIIVTTEYYYPQGMPSETEKKINNIDLTTLAIHFPDMIDSQGNKIFASLSEDGKGGDVINFTYDVNKNINETVLFKNIFITNFSNFKVIGVQQ